MKRDILNYLIEWRNAKVHLPLLLRGARQVGKTFLIEEFGSQYFDNMVAINFEEQTQYEECFITLDPQEILNRISIMAKQDITPGKTLLFLDEIQQVPVAITALRYFREKFPELHVIAAGSLLEFALEQENVSVPVGRIQYLYLKPVSFREFLNASGNSRMNDFLKTVDFQHPAPTVIHEQLLKLVREYMVIGGMPFVMYQYLQNKNLRECQRFQTSLLTTFQDDFGKYATKANHKYLQEVFRRTPALVGQQIKYSEISSDLRSRDLKHAIELLKLAGIITPVVSTAASGLPLVTFTNEKKFKLLFLDLGLMQRATFLDLELLLQGDLLLLNRGALAEQFVGQELMAYSDPYQEAQLYYWTREAKNSMAEVDYITHIDSQILPIEVKAGKTGSLRSLHAFLAEKKLDLGVRVSSSPLERSKHILSIPLYLISELHRLIRLC